MKNDEEKLNNDLTFGKKNFIIFEHKLQEFYIVPIIVTPALK